MRDGPAGGLPHVGEQSGDRFGNGHHHDWRRPSHTAGVAMSLTLQAALALALQCAPAIDPHMVVAIGQHESGLDPLTIHDNTTGQSLHGEGVIVAAEQLIAAGHSVDLGLMQINSHNLDLLRLPLRDAFCGLQVGRGGSTVTGTILEIQHGIADDRASAMATRPASWPSWTPFEPSRRPP